MSCLQAFFEKEVVVEVWQRVLRMGAVFVAGVEKFYDIETTFVDVEVDVALLEVGCHQSPYACVGV